MSPDPTREPEPQATAERAPASTAEQDALKANMSAIGTVRTGSLDATASAIGFANVSGDAALTASAAPVVLTKGNVSLHQCYTSAIIAGTEVDASQAGAPLIIGKKVRVEQGGAMVMVSGRSKVKHGFVGVLLTPQATVSEDSRVLVGTKAALIIAAALLGGFGLLAVVMAFGVKRVAAWRPHLNTRHLPQLAEIQERLHKMRGRPCCGRR